MKAMMTMNISTEADFSNRTRGVIRDILLDHREQLVQSEIEKGVITFMYPLVIIIFKPLKFPRFDELAEEEISLSIASKSAPLWGTMFHY